MDERRAGPALVTGASSGIGAELARELARHGHDLFLAGRDRGRLEALSAELAGGHGVQAEALPADLSSEAGVRGLAAAVAERAPDMEVLVNDAGVGMQGPFAESEPEALLAMLRLNVVALTLLTRLIVPRMRARGLGRILNVASTAAFVPGPFMACYYASKAYVLSFSVALSRELSGSGVTVTALCPGPTRSAFADRAGVAKARLFKGAGVMEAAEVARVGYRGLAAGRAIVVPGLRNRLLAASSGLGPRTLSARVAAALNRTT